MAVNNFFRTISGNSIMSTFGTDHVFAVISIGPINNFSPRIITQKTFLKSLDNILEVYLAAMWLPEILTMTDTMTH